ncbi:MAG: PHB depolymerase family esterase [Planctomycetota bacterium]
MRNSLILVLSSLVFSLNASTTFARGPTRTPKVESQKDLREKLADYVVEEIAATELLQSGSAVRTDQFTDPGDYSGAFRFDNRHRTYFLHVPIGYDGQAPMPLVVMLHGGGGTGFQVARDTGFNDLADAQGFHVVCPNAFPITPFDKVWADGRGTSLNEVRGVDDVGFVNAVVDYVSARLHVDDKRVYLAGVSNGSILAHRIACQQGNRFAAFSGVAGTFPDAIVGTCELDGLMPALFFHGTLDGFSPFDGGEVSSFRGGVVLSVSESMGLWSALNGCSSEFAFEDEPDLDPTDGTHVQRHDQIACPDSASVVTYVIEGGGHTWPDGPGDASDVFGIVTHDVNATRTIWDFFRQYSK